MGRIYSDSDYYVAPLEPPESRHPPLTSVGPLGWLRANLFSSWLNSLATLITAALILWFLWEFFKWTIRSAQWGIVYNNLRLITSGQYARGEIWRVELTAAILVTLIGLSMALWGRITRSLSLVVLLVLLVIVALPAIGSQIPEPTLYYLIQPRKTPQDIVFVGRARQDISFSVDPLTNPSDAEQVFIGYQEGNSRTDWSTQVRAIQTGQLDPTRYNLALTVRLLDAEGNVISSGGRPAELILEPGATAGGTRAVTLPEDGWYILETVRDDEAAGGESQGFAWLEVDGVHIWANQPGEAERRESEFGPAPERPRAILAEEKAFRYEGSRTFAEFISLQVSPLLRRLALPGFAGVGLFAAGWVGGRLSRHNKRVRRAVILGWVAAVPAILILLIGIPGSALLPPVPTKVWGGLLLTTVLTIVGISASFPLGIALALGRRSQLPVVKWTCTLFIEVVRGVPLITILFMAKLIVPFFWDPLTDLDLTVRMMIGLTLFTAAYLAENVRGGLQIVPHGQVEAARALGMGPFLTTTLIVLPQALRAVIPAIVGQFISLFKDTSLVALVGLFELVGIVDLIVSGSPQYRPYQREAYIFIALVYFIISYGMSDVSRRLEATGAGSIRR